MTRYLDYHPILVGCFLVTAALGALFLLLYLISYFTGFEF